jgi:hypothetical protein
MEINDKLGRACDLKQMWQPVSTAPYDTDLELAFVDKDEEHPLIFPCRRVAVGWIRQGTNELLDVRPTHWRKWPSNW